MIFSWLPVVWIDIVGPLIVLFLACLCAFRAKCWAQDAPENTLCQYVYLMTLAFVFFAVSRSFGHLVKQLLLYFELNYVWKQISPFSGAVNTASFIVIFAFGIYFHRSKAIHSELEHHRKHLEETVALRTSQLYEKNTRLKQALDEVKTLKGIIPICSKCKKIKDDKGYWQQVEQYITQHSEAEFSHGICQKCSDELYGGQDWYEEAVKSGEIPNS